MNKQTNEEPASQSKQMEKQVVFEVGKFYEIGHDIEGERFRGTIHVTCVNKSNPCECTAYLLATNMDYLGVRTVQMFFPFIYENAYIKLLDFTELQEMIDKWEYE